MSVTVEKYYKLDVWQSGNGIANYEVETLFFTRSELKDLRDRVTEMLDSDCACNS